MLMTKWRFAAGWTDVNVTERTRFSFRFSGHPGAFSSHFFGLAGYYVAWFLYENVWHVPRDGDMSIERVWWLLSMIWTWKEKEKSAYIKSDLLMNLRIFSFLFSREVYHHQTVAVNWRCLCYSAKWFLCKAKHQKKCMDESILEFCYVINAQNVNFMFALRTLTSTWIFNDVQSQLRGSINQICALFLSFLCGKLGRKRGGKIKKLRANWEKPGIMQISRLFYVTNIRKSNVIFLILPLVFVGGGEKNVHEPHIIIKLRKNEVMILILFVCADVSIKSISVSAFFFVGYNDLLTFFYWVLFTPLILPQTFGWKRLLFTCTSPHSYKKKEEANSQIDIRKFHFCVSPFEAICSTESCENYGLTNHHHLQDHRGQKRGDPEEDKKVFFLWGFELGRKSLFFHSKAIFALTSSSRSCSLSQIKYSLVSIPIDLKMKRLSSFRWQHDNLRWVNFTRELEPQSSIFEWIYSFGWCWKM